MSITSLDREKGPVWRWSDAISFFESVITPAKPDILMLNHGIWEGMEKYTHFREIGNLVAFVAAAKKSAPIVVWKTTTGKTRHDSAQFLNFMEVTSGLKIFDAFGMTHAMIKVQGAMWDGLHFQGFVYRELNIAFLEQLQIWFDDAAAALMKNNNGTLSRR